MTAARTSKAEARRRAVEAARRANEELAAREQGWSKCKPWVDARKKPVKPHWQKKLERGRREMKKIELKRSDERSKAVGRPPQLGLKDSQRDRRRRAGDPCHVAIGGGL